MLGDNRSERAIVVLDMINDMAHPEGRNYAASTTDIIPFLQGELQYFRERMRPVIFCNTVIAASAKPLTVDFPERVIQALSPRTGEICVTKTRPNAFFDTNLLQVLTGLKVKNITIVGAFSHTSVITTAASARDHGFSVVVPETCVCASDPLDHQAALRLINRWLNS